LHWRDHVVQKEAWIRPSDILINKADTSKAKELLGWEAKKAMPEVVAGLIEALEG
jgi:GDPmannose 4,6-dehydratase